MTIPVTPPPRRRTTPPAPLPTPMGYPVIGGPRRPETFPAIATFPTVNRYVTLEGHGVKLWPFRTGNAIIGMICKTRAGTTHMYRLMDGQWRYAGKAQSTDEADKRLHLMHERAQASALAEKVQPVAKSAIISPPRREPRRV